MATILDDIIQEKRKTVEQLYDEPINPINTTYTGPTFEKRVRESKQMAMIAEIKRASPSKGMINAQVHPQKQAIQYESGGANAISVLTDTPFFKGSMADLREVRRAVHLPILCKDFMIDKIQIDHAKAAGANIILLIAAALTDDKMQELYNHALANQLEVLCEVHNEEEMKRVLQLNPTLVGVNNRNLKTFDVDLSTTSKIANMVQDTDIILVGESGIKTVADVEQLGASGAEAILIGETLMRANNLEQTMKELQIPLHKKARHV